MEPNPKNNHYPVFEDNQVLSSANLNQIVNYLDEQERLTRANLIGIGIVCDLEITWNAEAATIYLSKGCGVTSEGYLIVEPDDVALVSYRKGYTLPDNSDYRSFSSTVPGENNTEDTVQYPLWELFPDGESETTLLSSPENFLNDKALVLFYELKKEGLRNCSSNDCNDKGSRKIATVRHLLIEKSDAESIIAKANDLDTTSTEENLKEELLAKFNLPELRLPRYAVPHINLATSAEVLAGFHAVFKKHKLVSETQKAFNAAYEAFEPLLKDFYPTNPFSDSSEFVTKFDFLKNKALETGEQVRFLQYYYEFFDNLLQAYNEFLQKGLALQASCCPSEKLFPRHLMAGLFISAGEVEYGIYRHHFMPSPATGGCAERKKEVQLLFQRLEQMVSQFTNSPQLPEYFTETFLDEQIRITPSKLGNVPLSDKAIPYYFNPSMYQLWNAEKTRLYRSNQNLGYHSPQYASPENPFVTDPLSYDLDPYNFLRIEGHLGKNYQNVLRTLLSLKNTYRLPIDVVAVHSGEALSSFLEQHPGIQHKAGVPIGGTFIVVYHEKSTDAPSRWSFRESPIITKLLRDNNHIADRLISSNNNRDNLAAFTPIDHITTGTYVREVVREAAETIRNSRPVEAPDEINEIITAAVRDIKPFLSNSSEKLSRLSEEDTRKFFELAFGVRPLPEREGIIAKTLDDLPDGAVLADFFLPYLRTDSVDNSSHPIIVRECEHKWIDSIRHINNLSLRDYRFNKMEKAPAANEQEKNRLRNHYIIRIYRYEIQGVSMLSGDKYRDIEIPISDIRKDKLSAVARKLNATFPCGLVFDYKPATGKVLMRHVEGHNFRIELGGIQGNRIRYAYEDNKIFRWQKHAWEELGRFSTSKNPCRIMGGGYEEDEYKWVHKNYKALYPEPAYNPTAKEVIQWQKKTLVRARKYSTITKLPIYETVLKSLRNEIRRIDSSAQVMLIGSWANGSWISRNMSENVASFNDSQQKLSRFLQLRKKVTGKAGYNDINLLVESDYEITPDMIRISTGYKINILKGKKDAQKGLELE